ncbi:WXG100 family type VII secretion target [Kitasatospora sp. GAS204B]|uniref:WXG100 family type VII secretion target n=1 Tax=unclassified Kitasatospora TaxID=2633591 RepID=UPI002474C21E|nr:WXG100 family type VII secretion target [Kitasatospora sp. GAS204B]MDH6116816.1 uncharacterized protein YukE [Kitasatospora sp. GAS204B]
MDISIEYDEIANCITQFAQASAAMEQDLANLIQNLTNSTESFQGPYKDPFDTFSQLLNRSHDQLTTDLQQGSVALQNISDALHQGDSSAASILSQH